MRFTLRYEGDDLLASGNDSKRKQEKQVLRSRFHNQLKRVWDVSNLLREVDRAKLPHAIKEKDVYTRPRPLPATTPTILGFLFHVEYYGSRFVPIITDLMEAHCQLAVRIGRPTKPGSIVFAGGDLDGRLKTLLDALSVPPHENQLDQRDVMEREYICLLSDDSLITGLSVESYQLWDECRPNHVVAEITVNITAPSIPRD